MPRIILTFISVILILIYSGCSNNTSKTKDSFSKNNQEVLTNNNNQKEIKNSQEGNKKTPEVIHAPALTKNDFDINDNSISISLGEDWKGSEFLEKQGIKEIGSNFVGNPFENLRYKSYVHDFKDFKIYITDFKAIENYSISQIDVLSERFFTSRGIKIGSLKEDIQQKYGAVKSSKEDGYEVLSYSLDEYYIDFVMDKDQVKLIRLGWIPRNLEKEPESGIPKLY